MADTRCVHHAYACMESRVLRPYLQENNCCCECICSMRRASKNVRAYIRKQVRPCMRRLLLLLRIFFAVAYALLLLLLLLLLMYYYPASFARRRAAFRRR